MLKCNQVIFEIDVIVFRDYVFTRTFVQILRKGRVLTPAILFAANASRALTRKCATPVQWIGNIFAGSLCAIIPQLRPISTNARTPEWILCNGRVTAHRPLIFRACHRNSISARWWTPARNSNSVSVVASINYSIGQLAGNN